MQYQVQPQVQSSTYANPGTNASNTGGSNIDQTGNRTQCKCSVCGQLGHYVLFRCPKLPNYVLSKYPQNHNLPPKVCRICLTTDVSTENCRKHEKSPRFVCKVTGYSPLLCECPQHKSLQDYFRSQKYDPKLGATNFSNARLELGEKI